MVTLTVEITVPPVSETGDLCWTPDGVQCFYDAVLKQAHYQVSKMLIGAISDQNVAMQQHHQLQLDIVSSVTVNGIKVFD